MAFLAAAALLVCGGWLTSYAWRPFVLPDALIRVRYGLVCLALWAAYPLVQLLPLPPGLVDVVGGGAHTLYKGLPGSAAGDSAYLSLDRGATLFGWLRQCGLLALFASVLVLATSRRRLKAIMILVLVVGFVEALYGILVSISADDVTLWAPGQADGTVSGTYVNQNHFAGLMEVTIPVGMGLLLATRPTGESTFGSRSLLRMFSAALLSERGVILFCILIMSAALILTTSRGGIGSLAVGILVAIAIAVARNGLRAREIRVGVAAVAVALVAVFWLGSGQFSEKLQSAGLSSDRSDQREISYQIFRDSPVSGTGVGTYRWVFPIYKDERFGAYFYEHAHNDFLEVLTEQGIVGLLLLSVGIALVLVRIVRSYVVRHDPLMRGALFASVAGCVSLLVHGMVDFNLQIPANAGYFAVLLGLGVVAGELHHRSPERLPKELGG
jgi:O-antigen ligase